MPTQVRIKSALDRLVSALRVKPGVGQVTRSAVCELGDGLTGECDAVGFSFGVDVGEELGGLNTAPNPGAYGRSAVAACIAIGCAMEFAIRELPQTGIRVTVAADMDVRGGLGVDGVAPGFKKLRYVVEVSSSADPARIRDAINDATAKSTMLQCMARPIPIEGEVRINA